jgi:[ribosomal protein S18]-alanine N-acetyltransferase
VNGLWVGPALAGDLPAIVAIERASYSHPWSEESLRSAIEDVPGTRIAVLRSGREPLAYCISQVAADEVQVLNLAVHPEHRRRGLARRLLNVALRAASQQGARTAWLEVRESNESALALYRGFGFELRGVRRGYYESPREDALVLALSLAAAAPAAVAARERPRL